MEPFKNMLGMGAAQKIATAVQRADTRFSTRQFLNGLEDELEPLELKQRMLVLKRRLSEQFDPHPKSFPILVKALAKNDSDKVGLDGFLVWPLTQFVADHGLEDFEKSLNTLKEMTKVFTAEFAVRPFFLKDEAWMLDTFQAWAKDSNEHVRRLVSEGSRPLLPWGMKLPRFLENPNLTWPLLYALRDDASKYVQKSVANHMNDLSKQNGDWLVKQLKTWPNAWVSSHATRTLVKQGHTGALKLLGVEQITPQIKAAKLETTKIKLGQSLKNQIEFRNHTKKTIKMIVDVEIHFLKANGKHSAKVFKGRKFSLEPGETVKQTINTPIKKVTTRKYYFGEQFCSLVVNGKRLPKKKFVLVK